jgi:hypothetical protein
MFEGLLPCNSYYLQRLRSYLKVKSPSMLPPCVTTGVGYTTIPAGLPPGQFNLVQKGVDIITQAVTPSEVPLRVWGAYSGIDMHPTLNTIYSAVGYAGNPSGQWAQSNAVTNIAQYV